MVSKTGRRVVVLAVLVAAMVTPIAIASIFGLTAAISPWMYGGITVAAALFVSPRLAVACAVAGGLSMAVATLLHPYPVLGGLYVGLVMAISAGQARRGLHSVVLMIPVVTAFAVAQPTVFPQVTGALATAALVGVLGVAGGLWTVLVARVLLVHGGPSTAPVPVGERATRAFAALTGLTVGAATWAVLTWFPSHQGAWLLLTLMVVMQPDPHDTAVRSVSRAGGTILGVIAAGLISLVLPPAATGLMLGLGSLALLGSLVARYALKRPYWQYVALMTPAVILLDSAGDDVKRVAEDRLLFTLTGAVVAIGIAIVVRLAIGHLDDEKSAPTPA